MIIRNPRYGNGMVFVVVYARADRSIESEIQFRIICRLFSAKEILTRWWECQTLGRVCWIKDEQSGIKSRYSIPFNHISMTLSKYDCTTHTHTLTRVHTTHIKTYACMHSGTHYHTNWLDHWRLTTLYRPKWTTKRFAYIILHINSQKGKPTYEMVIWFACFLVGIALNTLSAS